MRQKRFLLYLILLLAIILRFYNLMFDSPYFFNPDERNMAVAITQFRLPKDVSKWPDCFINEFTLSTAFERTHLPLDPQSSCNLNPHFFAYGQFPLYLSYFSDQITQRLPISRSSLPITQTPILITDFTNAIFWLRIYSAISSVCSIIFIYVISKRIFQTTSYIPYVVATLGAFTPGLIQSAHFGTTESFLSCFFMGSIYFSISLFDQTKTTIRYNLRSFFMLCLVIGMGMGSKLTGLFFLIPPLFSLITSYHLVLRQHPKKFHLLNQRISLKYRFATASLIYICIGMTIVLLSILFAIASSPYNIVDPMNFKGSVFGYEKDVATGAYEAFYTRQFVHTIPILFQLQYVFPYALGWPLFILGSIGFILLICLTIISWLRELGIITFKFIRFPVTHWSIGSLFIASFLIYTLPNAFLFAKWTRFMTPIFLFFPIFAGVTLTYMLILSRRILTTYHSRKLFQWLLIPIALLAAIPGIAFMSIYSHEDSRVQASRWIYKNIPDRSYLLFETANVVDIPLGIPNIEPKNYTEISFDFYHLDENPLLFEELLRHLEKTDYIFIPSRRIFANYTKQPKKYPLVNKYYNLLWSGKLGFQKVSEFNSFPSLGKVQFPDEQAEETSTVFDHPVIRIYKKITPLTTQQYRQLFL